MTLKLGGLFEGYGGLTEGVRSVLGGEIAWHSEIDPGACKILAHRYPDVPNLGDITTVDWSQVEPVDVLAAGYPCQPFSAAGKRQGTDDVRHLWPYAAKAIGNLRPEWVVLENVRGHLTLGFDQVLFDLDLLHYEARWVVLRAADIGAPHGRARIFILGRNRGRQLRSWPDRRGGLHRHPGSRGLNAAPVEDRHDGQGASESDRYASGVRGEADRRSSGWRADPSDARLAAQRQEGCGRDRAAGIEVPHESGASPDRAGVSADDRRSSEAGESLGGLERGDAPAVSDTSRPHSGGEPERTRSSAASAAAGSTSGGTAVRGVVGPGRGSVRPGGVHGALPHVGDDDRGAHLPDLSSATSACVDQQPAPHPADDGREWAGCAWHGRSGSADHGDAASDTDHAAGHGEWARPEPREGSEAAAYADVHGLEGIGRLHPVGRGADGRSGADVAWGQYEPAIRRWEQLTRPAPAPTEPGRNGPRLSARFVEWMQGLPAGWVTDVPGLSRNEQLKALGNGVVPQQAAQALRMLLGGDALAAPSDRVGALLQTPLTTTATGVQTLERQVGGRGSKLGGAA